MQERYSRQTRFQPIGHAGQQQIQQKHVLIIGAGALGSANAEALTRAGVGTITIIDRDYVEESNLHRQSLYTEHDAIHKTPKAIAAKNALNKINENVTIHAIVDDVTVRNIVECASGKDIIMDGTDNFETRRMVNDIAYQKGIPWIYGACVGSYGTTMTFIPKHTPCFHCLFPETPLHQETCDTVGIIAPTVQMVVSHQVASALKLLVGAISSVDQRWTSFDVWHNQHYAMDVHNAYGDQCPTCGSSPSFPNLNHSNTTKTTVLCGRDSVQVRPAAPKEINLGRMTALLQKEGFSVTSNDYLLSANKGTKRIILFMNGRAIFHGTNDEKEARQLYQRYIPEG
ncbi:ThiF family adenylyltransferase [Pontibacillus salicampi]|uniref:ThiF family adenylyltransferase n=1 Tax=Pontibacillus salicampi TaxID=1449801 RepID=A0ABV6LPM5_9BACI